jgi:tRNA(adenine34) deaminase
MSDLLTNNHEFWMKKALKLAFDASKVNEVPIGCVIVYDNKIIGQGYNQCESLNDSTAHAEILAITSASNTLGDWRLNQCSLYVTKEPCIMCAGAIVNSRIDSVFFGCYDEDLGACGSKFDICGNPSLKTPLTVRGNILGVESLALIRNHFHELRKRQQQI